MSNSCCCNEKNACCPSDVAQGTIRTADTQITFKDKAGAWKVRWGIGRMTYTVDPGLYSVGSPDSASPVLVSANYKLTYDTLRKELAGLDCWLLLLDTKGVNVWCAAGKGTFGTEELLSKLENTGLSDIITHRNLILPQLGAVGISAHEVKRQSGFTVMYGPVRASDIREYLSSGCEASEAMRTVRFTTWDRLVLTPVELISAVKKALPVFGVLFILNLIAARPFGISDFIACMGAIVIGTVLTPVLLPVIPGNAFAWKGWLLGVLWAIWVILANRWNAAGSWLLAIGYLLVLPSVSAYLAMKFTGSTTYTSFSGVIREMKIAIPLMIISSILGIILILVKTFTGA